MDSSLLRGVAGRTVLPQFVVIGGFAGIYAATGNPFICAMWASLIAHEVLLRPWYVDAGRVNHTSVLFVQPVAVSEREKARIIVDSVTTRQRCEAALVVAVVFALMLVALALALTG